MTPAILEMPPGDLCRRRYPGHPHGCPNYGMRATCPPQRAPLSVMLPDPARKWYAVWTTFPIGQHVEKMGREHPAWSDRQRRCCLYWQKGAIGNLRREVWRMLAELSPACHIEVYVPEAAGVNVTLTMMRVGVKLEWPPVNVAHQVALVAINDRNVLAERSKDAPSAVYADKESGGRP